MRARILVIIFLQIVLSSFKVINGGKISSNNGSSTEVYENSVNSDNSSSIQNKSSSSSLNHKIRNLSTNSGQRNFNEHDTIPLQQKDNENNLLSTNEPLKKIESKIVLRDLTHISPSQKQKKTIASSENEDTNLGEHKLSDRNRYNSDNLLYVNDPLDKVGGGVVLRDVGHTPPFLNNLNKARFTRDINSYDNLLYLNDPLDKVGGGVVLRDVDHTSSLLRNKKAHFTNDNKMQFGNPKKISNMNDHYNDDILDISMPLDKVGGGVVLREADDTKIPEDVRFRKRKPKSSLKVSESDTNLRKHELGDIHSYDNDYLLYLSVPLDKVGGGVVLRDVGHTPQFPNNFRKSRLTRDNKMHFGNPNKISNMKHNYMDELLYLSAPLDKVGGGVVLREVDDKKIPENVRLHTRKPGSSLEINGSDGANKITVNSSESAQSSNGEEISKSDFLVRHNFSTLIPKILLKNNNNMKDKSLSDFHTNRKIDFDDTDKSGSSSQWKRDFDEIDKSGFNKIWKRDFDEIDKSGFNKLWKRDFDEIDKSGFNKIWKRDFDEIDKSGFNKLWKRDFDEIDKSGFNKIWKRDFDEIDKSGFNKIWKRDFDEIDKSGFNKLWKRDFDELDKSGFKDIGKRDFDEIDQSGFNNIGKRDFDELDKLGFNGIGKREYETKDKSISKIIKKRHISETENDDEKYREEKQPRIYEIGKRFFNKIKSFWKKNENDFREREDIPESDNVSGKKSKIIGRYILKQLIPMLLKRNDIENEKNIQKENFLSKLLPPKWKDVLRNHNGLGLEVKLPLPLEEIFGKLKSLYKKFKQLKAELQI